MVPAGEGLAAALQLAPGQVRVDLRGEGQLVPEDARERRIVLDQQVPVLHVVGHLQGLRIQLQPGLPVVGVHLVRHGVQLIGELRAEAVLQHLRVRGGQVQHLLV